MKRGFLNKPKYKKAIEEADASPSPHEPEGTAKIKHDKAIDGANAPVSESPPLEPEGGKKAGPAQVKECEECIKDANVDVYGAHPPCWKNASRGAVPPRPPPGRTGWGRSPAEKFFHVIPGSQEDGETGRKRAVFNFWPRDPMGEVLQLDPRRKGTLSPDGYPWGATLYDFFLVNRMTLVHNAVSTMTGSALCQAMEDLGELDVAVDQIEWAKSEGKPEVLGVADTEELIRQMDQSVSLLPSRNADATRTEEKAAVHGNNDGRDDDKMVCDGDAKDASDEARDEGNVECKDTAPIHTRSAPTMPVTSPFHPSHYPEPWPFTPFENPYSILLQERIPLYLLPQTLHVHDPFDLLGVWDGDSFHDTSWTSQPDIIRTYDLYLSTTGPVRSQVEEARRKVEELEEFKARTLIVLRYMRTKEQIKNHEPVIQVPLPPYIRRPTKVEESHLYLSPIAQAGQGHHSVVYKAEWELPRNMFTKTKVCKHCFRESLVKEVQRLKDTGRWEKMLRAASWGPNGFTGRKPTREELDAAGDPINLEQDGEIVERELICIVPPDYDMDLSKFFESIDESDIWDKLFTEKRKVAELYFSQSMSNEDHKDGAPLFCINPPYSEQKSCTHSVPVPRTAIFTVIAKLSIENDPHLRREARNYQQFPERFFHHYNGYTMNRQLHTIVPVNAVVPQFYGYYTPREEVDNSSYLSPILLIEHCGEPIKPNELSHEDQEECASLLLRFQTGGWLHGSVAPRNFLVQRGKPTEFPHTRKLDPELSFRLIDFGRSTAYKTVVERQAEESETLTMFAQLDTMGYTLG